MKPMFAKEQLVKHLRDMGVQTGVVLCAHTSYKAIAPVEGGGSTVVDALLDAVGPSGTLVLPAFTFSYCKTGRWDRHTTPSEMGVITEDLRTRPGAQRSFHPIYSFVAIGARAREYGDCRDENGVGDGSPFPLLLNHDAIITAMGVGYNQSFTLGHHIEWQEGVDYRYLKVFPGEVSDDAVPQPGRYSMLVRDLDKGVVTDYRKLGYMMEHDGAMRIGRFGWAITRCIRAREFDRLARQWLRQGVPDLMHRIDATEVYEEKAVEILSL